MKHQQGRIEVICGSMFSGKTEELLRRLKRANIAKQKVIVFKPLLDNRYSQDSIVSHDKNSIESINIRQANTINTFDLQNIDVIGIDEAQFLDKRIISIVKKLANDGKRVIISGLDTDYKGEPFGSMPNLMSIADEVSKIHAVCMDCGGEANFTFRKPDVKISDTVLVGEKDKYEALCRNCFNEKFNEKNYE